MSAMAFQITSLTIVYSTVYSGADQRKHQRSTPLAFVRGIHRWPVNSPHNGPVTRKMFHLMTSSWYDFLWWTTWGAWHVFPRWNHDIPRSLIGRYNKAEIIYQLLFILTYSVRNRDIFQKAVPFPITSIPITKNSFQWGHRLKYR